MMHAVRRKPVEQEVEDKIKPLFIPPLVIEVEDQQLPN
jgi:hypothetical protein